MRNLQESLCSCATLIGPLFLAAVWLGAAPENNVYEQASADIRQGKLQAAEQLLRSHLQAQPRDPEALGLLAVVLDSEKRYGDAELCYQRALALDPRSSILLNNLGNHYLARGELGQARGSYLKVLALDPHHPNANLQLATMSVASRQGHEALHYLEALPGSYRREPAVRLLQAKALYLAGDHKNARSLLSVVEDEAASDPRVAFSVGMIYVEWKAYDRAEQALSRALSADPTNFEILSNLGLAAYYAGHFPRAREVFQTASKQKPDDPDALYNLARAESQLGHIDQAIVLLVRAHQLAPQHGGILLAMANVFDQLGFYDDEAKAFNEYLKTRPDDDLVRREAAFALARTDKHREGLEELRAYVTRHPNDPRGLYELGVAEVVLQPQEAIRHLNRAVALEPSFMPARYARGVLRYRKGDLRAAEDDLSFIVRGDPHNSDALDTLGQVEIGLGKMQEAVRVLAQAAELAPRNRKILLHYSQALRRVREFSQAEAVLRQLELLPPTPPKIRSGLLDYLSLPVGRQQARYLEHLQTDITMNPQNLELKARWAEAQLRIGKSAEALQTFEQILAADPSTRILSQCGQILLKYGHYAEARPFLEKVLAREPSRSDVRLDLSVALFHSLGPQAALAELDGTPAEMRRGDYYLLRAQILDAEGKAQEAARDLTLGLGNSATREDLYYQAALFLIKHNQLSEVLEFLRQAVQQFPNSRQLLLTQAIAFGIVHQEWKAKKILDQIEERWPEWPHPYLIHAIILVGEAKRPQAKPLAETAIALGNQSALAYFIVALADMESPPPQDTEDAEQAIQKSLQLNPNDPYAQSLAGKIAYARKDYPRALRHLEEALKLWPEMVEAHQTLSGTYRAMGEKDKSIAELKEVLRIKQQTRTVTADQAPPRPDLGLKNFLFSVPASAPPGS